MSLQTQLTEDAAAALKAGDSERVSTLRLVLTAMKNEQIKLQKELSDDEQLKVVQREAKQRRDSITAYEQADREDLASKERSELTLIEAYLPAQLSDDELAAIVRQAITDAGATSAADMGKVMSAAMATVAGRADGGRVSTAVKQQLS